MQMKSPNGSPIVGTLEVVKGRANATEYEEDGTPLYEGDTEIFWDEQRTVTNKAGKALYLDEDGDHWTWDQLTPDDEEAGE